MNMLYKLYLEKVLKLVTSLCIKSEYAARRINAWVTANGYEVNPSEPTSWKYYMNLNGDHHPIDPKIYVVSQDTFEEIEFNKETLKEHILTKRAYLTKGRHWDELVRSYPNQETLLRGILNPVDYTTSIDAVDHKILDCDENLIEPQETFLLHELQSYIDGVYDRWFNQDYQRIEQDYILQIEALIISNLPMQVLLSRKRRRHTDLAHSYHIEMYLLSFSTVGGEFRYLSKRQKLWLYRNIRYINRNVGKNGILDLVTRNIMNDRGFPVRAIDIKFDYAKLGKEPDPDFKVVGKDLGYMRTASTSTISDLSMIFAKELSLAPYNSDYRTYDHEVMVDKLKKAKYDNLPTKILESSITDKTDAEPFTFRSVLFNMWGHMAEIGEYHALVSVTVPSTGAVHRLDMMEAFVLYVYSLTRFENVLLDNVPCIFLQRVLKPTPPTYRKLNELRAAYTPDYFLEYIYTETPAMRTVVSVVSFNEFATEVHRSSNSLRTMRHFQRDYKVEGNLHQIMDQFYCSREIKPYSEQSFEGWFSERDIEIEQWSRDDFIEVAAILYEKCTGASIDRGSALKELHSAMIRVFNELTSYSVHLVPSVNDNPIKIVDTKFPKLTVPYSQTESDVELDTSPPSLMTPHKIRLNGKVNIGGTGVKIFNSDICESTRAYVPANSSLGVSTSSTTNILTAAVIPAITPRDKPIVDITSDEYTNELDIVYPNWDIEGPWGQKAGPMYGDHPYMENYSLMTPQRMLNFLRL